MKCFNHALIFVLISVAIASPIETSVANFHDSNILFSECRDVLTDCLSKSDTIKEKAHCFVDLGKCVGEKAVVCAKPCLIPFAMCQMAAGVTWPALMKCGKEFLRCSMAACIKNEEPQTLEADMMQLEDLAENNHLTECLGELKDCLSESGSIKEKAACFGNLGQCMVIKAVSCAKPCVRPYAECHMAAGVEWPAIVKCRKEFVRCAVAACVKNEEPQTLEADIMQLEDLAESNHIITECKDVLTDCVSKSGTIKEKAHCFVDLGQCVGQKAAVCAKSCLMPFAMCQMAAGVTWPAIMKCGKEFLRCSVAACTTNEATTNMVELPVDNEMSAYEFAIQAVDDNSVSFTRCKNEFYTCIKAQPGIKAKFQCFTQLGKCAGGELIGCSAHCIPQFALCKYEAKGSWIKTAVCAVKFLTCAKEGCINE